MSTIKADPTDQQRLLDLQAVDTHLAQLLHRRKSLPEHAEVASITAHLDGLSQELIRSGTVVADLELEQAKAESDLEPVRGRLVRNEKRIADGTVVDSKVLSGLVEEVEHLKRRIGTLEDAELDVMQRVEDASTEYVGLTHRQEALEAQLAEVIVERDRRVAEIDAEARIATTERKQVVGGVPADLLAAYDKIRSGRGGVGAAELKHRRCTGCQLELAATDLRRYAAAPDDEVLRCEDCTRILIRTSESGI